MTEPNTSDHRPSAAAGHPGPLSAHYRASRLRLRELVESLPPDRLDDPVAACPGWSVHDVVAHLTANVEDAAAGRLSRPPGPEQTAEQVARHRDTPVAELFELWWAGAAAFEEGVDAFEIVPAVLDMLSHEHDAHQWVDPNDMLAFMTDDAIASIADGKAHVSALLGHIRNDLVTYLRVRPAG